MRHSLSALTLLAFFLLFLGPADSAGALAADDFEVVIPAAVLNTPTAAGTLGKSLARITALANGQACDSADVSAAATDVTLHLGLAGQPAACSLEGARVTFLDGGGRELFVEMTLRKGTVQT